MTMPKKRPTRRGASSAIYYAKETIESKEEERHIKPNRIETDCSKCEDVCIPCKNKDEAVEEVQVEEESQTISMETTKEVEDAQPKRKRKSRKKRNLSD